MATTIASDNLIDYTPGAAVAAGAVVVIGDLIGIAAVPIEANRLGSLAIRGTSQFPKAAGAAINAGAKVYWDSANSVATATSGGNKFLGVSPAGALSAATTVVVVHYPPGA